MKFKIPQFADKARKKVNSEAIKAKVILSGQSGESNNTSGLGGIILSLLVIAIVIGFATGFIQNTFFPDFKSHYTNLWG